MSRRSTTRFPEACTMTASLDSRQLHMFRTALGSFPAPWRFIDHYKGQLNAETLNPAETMILRITASAETDTILLTLLRASDRAFMAEAEFPLAAWHSAKDFLEAIALEGFVIGVDERDGSWRGSMILRSADLVRRRDFSYVRSWLGTYDLN
jgi:hypothetical protein